MSEASLHPSPTASDGQPIDQSHYIKKSERLDNMIECAQCGFIVDLTKRSTGKSMGAIPNPTITTGSITDSQIGNIRNPPIPPYRALAAFSDSYGDPVDSNSGCPFCNSMNPKGLGRDTDPFFANVKNIENF